MSRILVVDDEQAIGRAMKWELKGHDVRVVSTLAEALLALCRERFDAVICDWNLGRTETGEHVLEVARKLNAQARRFIVSGVVPDTLAQMLISGIAHRFIAKPWRPHDVRDAVKQELAA
jgi:DNA-binding NtrC family response regulator